jgi:hypothetical protein
MLGHVEMNNAAAVMSQDQEHVKDMETDGRHGEEIHRNKLRYMILKEGAPSLRGRLTDAQHVFTDARLADVDSELEQFSVNAGCTPSRIFSTHPADQIPDVGSNRRTARLAVPNFPSPEETKAFAMPGQDCFRLHNDEY